MQLPVLSPIPNSMASASLLAHLIVSEFSDGMPLQRIAGRPAHRTAAMPASFSDVRHYANGRNLVLEAGSNKANRVPDLHAARTRHNFFAPWAFTPLQQWPSKDTRLAHDSIRTDQTYR